MSGTIGIALKRDRGHGDHRSLGKAFLHNSTGPLFYHLFHRELRDVEKAQEISRNQSIEVVGCEVGERLGEEYSGVSTRRSILPKFSIAAATTLAAVSFFVFGIANGKWSQKLALVSGLLSVAFGGLVAIQILWVNDLFTGHPTWTPK